MALNSRIRAIPLPHRMRKMHVSAEGYPVPWFVAWVDGQPEFRAIDHAKLRYAHVYRKCWLCGEKMGRYMSFVIGPMCMVNQISSEPPAHHDCAQYAVRACPFLTQPRMRRNEKDLPEERTPAPGIGLDRNPGVAVIWTTLSYTPFQAYGGGKGVLFRIGLPVSVEFWAQGRRATRQEVLNSIDSGLPQLRQVAEEQGTEAVEALMQQYHRALQRVPAEPLQEAAS